MYPKQLESLIENLQKLPGIGRKTAERYAFTILKWSDNDIDQFTKVLSTIKKDIKHCKICGNISDSDICKICEDSDRNHNIICIVETEKDLIAMEKTGEYKGVYHVLSGVISISKGIMPNELNLTNLIERINDDIEEIIIALNPSLDGETTTLYLMKLLEQFNIKVSKIAYGIPMGGNLDYADEITLVKALKGRSICKYENNE